MPPAPPIVAYTPAERLQRAFLRPHPFACRVWGCRAPVTWRDHDDIGVGLGYCDAHVAITRHARSPIAIYGDEGSGWMGWPPDVRVRMAIERTREDD
jgi:hypothetical protein